MEVLQIDLPKEVKSILNALEKNGYSAFVVGGCVRDSIMGKVPNDWDITTSASPDETATVFAQKKLILNGVKHGTVGIVENGEVFEVTSFRTESGYSDNRHPDSVTFVEKIEDDLARRDFTVNSIAYSPESGMVDPFGGKKDIDNKIIRCVGNAEKRFDEDALRIMRAVRFSSGLGFEVEQKTAEMIHEKKSLLKNVSVERIRDELEKLILGKNVSDVLHKFDDVIFTIIPELSKTKNLAQNCVYHKYDVWDHICRSVEVSENERIIRLTMLLHDIGKPNVKTTDKNGADHFYSHALAGSKMTEEILKRLKFDNHTVNEVTQLVVHHDDRLYLRLEKLPFFINRFGYDFLRKLDKVSRADIMAQNDDYLYRLSLCDEFIKKLDEFEEKNICVFISQLEVNGNDLKQLGFEGKEIGFILHEMLEKIMKNELENKKNILLDHAKKKHKQQ